MAMEFPFLFLLSRILFSQAAAAEAAAAASVVEQNRRRLIEQGDYYGGLFVLDIGDAWPAL